MKDKEEQNNQVPGQENMDFSDLNIGRDFIYKPGFPLDQICAYDSGFLRSKESDSYVFPNTLINNTIMKTGFREEVESSLYPALAGTRIREIHEPTFDLSGSSAIKTNMGLGVDLTSSKKVIDAVDETFRVDSLSIQNNLRSYDEISLSNTAYLDQSNSTLTNNESFVDYEDIGVHASHVQAFEKSNANSALMAPGFEYPYATVHLDNPNCLTLAGGLDNDLVCGSHKISGLSLAGEMGIGNLALTHFYQPDILDQQNVNNVEGAALNYRSDLLANEAMITGTIDRPFTPGIDSFATLAVEKTYGFANYDSEIFDAHDSNDITDTLIDQTVNEALDHFGKSITFDQSKISIESFARTYHSNRSDTLGSIVNIVMVNIINIEGDVSHNNIRLGCQTTN